MNLIFYTTSFSKTLYHTTTRDRASSILSSGILGKYALDPKSKTNTHNENLGIKDGRSLVYLANRKKVAKIMASWQNTRNKDNSIIFKIKIPRKDYKELKRIYDNPEMHGMTKKEYINELYEKYLERYPKASKLKKLYAKYYFLPQAWNDFSGAKGTSGTRIIEGNIDKKYIKELKVSNYIE